MSSRLTAVLSAALSVTVNSEEEVTSTFDVVRVRVPLPCPVRVSLVTSISLLAPLSAVNSEPSTVRTPVPAS